jgi:DinB superfamily
VGPATLERREGEYTPLKPMAAEGTALSLPAPVERLWRDLEAVRAEVLDEVTPLSQAQVDWRASEKDWSVGEILHHLTLAEVATGKLTTKLTREAHAGGAPAVFPHDLTEFPELPVVPEGPTEAPPAVRPESGKPIGELVADLRAVRARSRQSVEKLATVDPRRLVFTHVRFGVLDLSQWWTLQARHDRIHRDQIREVKAAPGFPRA